MCTRFLITWTFLGLSAGLANAADEAPVLDKEFLIQAASVGHAEVEFSKLADSRASSERVKEFARRMIQEHGKANEELAKQARNQKVAVLAGLEREKRETQDRLSKLKDAEFDRAYMQQMTADHEKAIKLFEGQAKRGSDADLKHFASTTLPHLREHLKEARAIAATLK
jgi:putative membrane protein